MRGNFSNIKKRAKVSIIDLLPIILTLVLLIATVCVSLIISPSNQIVTILLCVVGLLLNYVAGILIHEAGHVLTAKRFGMNAIYLNLGIVTIDLYEHKITPFTFFKKDAGEARFLPTKEVDSKQIKKIALSGLIVSLIFFVVGVSAGIVISIITNSPTAFCLFTVGQISNFYIFAVNALSSDKTSDGSIAFCSDEYPTIIAVCANIERSISLGVIPEEPQVIQADNQPIALYYHYLFTAKSLGRDAAFDILPSDIDLNKLNDMEYALLFPELLFKACKQSSMSDELKSLAESFFANEPNGISVIRAHCAFRRYVGDNQWAEILQGSYNKLLNEQNEFIALVEKALSL